MITKKQRKTSLKSVEWEPNFSFKCVFLHFSLAATHSHIPCISHLWSFSWTFFTPCALNITGNICMDIFLSEKQPSPHNIGQECVMHPAAWNCRQTVIPHLTRVTFHHYNPLMDRSAWEIRRIQMYDSSYSVSWEKKMGIMKVILHQLREESRFVCSLWACVRYKVYIPFLP